MQKDNFSTLKGELLPYLIKKQMSKRIAAQILQGNSLETGGSAKQEVDILSVS